MSRSAFGQTLTEYGVIMALVAVASLGALTLLGNHLSQGFTGLVQVKAMPLPPISVPFHKPPGGTPSAAGVTGTSTGALGGTTGNLVPLINTATTAVDHSSVQVSGANGSLGVFQDTDRLLYIADAYKDDPQTYNALVALGLKGQQMSKAMGACEKTGMRCDTTTLNGFMTEFSNLWNQQVQSSAVFQKLSPQDQQLVTALTGQSQGLANTLYGQASKDPLNKLNHTGVGAYDNVSNPYASGQVGSNSSQTITCGQTGKCG